MQAFRRKTLQYLTPAGLFVITFLINAIKISQMSLLLIMKGARDESKPLMLIKQFPILSITGSWQQDLHHVLWGLIILSTDRKSIRLNSSHANISYAVF